MNGIGSSQFGARVERQIPESRPGDTGLFRIVHIDTDCTKPYISQL